MKSWIDVPINQGGGVHYEFFHFGRGEGRGLPLSFCMEKVGSTWSAPTTRRGVGGWGLT